MRRWRSHDRLAAIEPGRTGALGNAVGVGAITRPLQARLLAERFERHIRGPEVVA